MYAACEETLCRRDDRFSNDSNRALNKWHEHPLDKQDGRHHCSAAEQCIIGIRGSDDAGREPTRGVDLLDQEILTLPILRRALSP